MASQARGSRQRAYNFDEANREDMPVMNVMTAIAVNDLSNASRDRMTAHDRERDRVINEAAINRVRKCNIGGSSEASDAARDKAKLKAWHRVLPDGDASQQEDIAGGQYHRERVSREIRIEVANLEDRGVHVDANNFDQSQHGKNRNLKIRFQGVKPINVHTDAHASQSNRKGAQNSLQLSKSKPFNLPQPAVEHNQNFRSGTGGTANVGGLPSIAPGRSTNGLDKSDPKSIRPEIREPANRPSPPQGPASTRISARRINVRLPVAGLADDSSAFLQRIQRTIQPVESVFATTRVTALSNVVENGSRTRSTPAMNNSPGVKQDVGSVNVTTKGAASAATSHLVLPPNDFLKALENQVQDGFLSSIVLEDKTNLPAKGGNSAASSFESSQHRTSKGLSLQGLRLQIPSALSGDECTDGRLTPLSMTQASASSVTDQFASRPGFRPFKLHSGGRPSPSDDRLPNSVFESSSRSIMDEPIPSNGIPPLTPLKLDSPKIIEGRWYFPVPDGFDPASTTGRLLFLTMKNNCQSASTSSLTREPVPAEVVPETALTPQVTQQGLTNSQHQSPQDRALTQAEILVLASRSGPMWVMPTRFSDLSEEEKAQIAPNLEPRERPEAKMENAARTIVGDRFGGAGHGRSNSTSQITDHEANGHNVTRGRLAPIFRPGTAPQAPKGNNKKPKMVPACFEAGSWFLEQGKTATPTQSEPSGVVDVVQPNDLSRGDNEPARGRETEATHSGVFGIGTGTPAPNSIADRTRQAENNTTTATYTTGLTFRYNRQGPASDTDDSEL